MRKFTVLIGLVMMLTLAMPLATFAASFQWIINVTNSTSTVYSKMPFTAPINTAAWISSNYIQSNGLDVKVMDGSSALPTEVTDTGLWWVGNIGEKTTKTFTLATGNAPATSMPIIVGNGGYLTTPYNPSLELGSGWEIDIQGYVNTSDINAYILNKSGEATIKVTALNQITATVYDGSGAETIILSSIISGAYSMSLALSSGTLTFIVGSSSRTTSVNTVVNNTNDWIWDSDGLVMPYIHSVSLSLDQLESASFIYVEKQNGGNDSIYQLNASDLSNTSLSWAFPSGYTAYPHSMCTDGTYIYIVGQSSSNVAVFKINASSMTSTGSLLYAGAQMNQRWPGQGQIMCEDGGNLYLIEPFSGSPQTYPVDKISTVTMEVLGGGGSAGQALACSGGYLYCLFDGVEISGISKYSESDLSTLVHGAGVPYTTCDITCVGNIFYVRRTAAAGGGIYAYNGTSFASLGLWFAGNDDGTALTAAGTDLLQINHNGTTGPNASVNDWFYNNDNTLPKTGNSWADSHAGSAYALCGDGANHVYVTDSSHVYELNRNSPSSMAQLASTALMGNSDNIALGAASSTTLVEVVKYQPVAIILGTDLPNRDDNTGDTDSVITWGTNLSGITTVFGGFTPITIATAPISGGGGTLNPTSQYPGDMPPLTSEGNFSNIPGASVVDPVLNSSDIPLDLFWDILIFAGILGLGFAVMILTNQIWIVGAACSVGFAIFSYNTNNGIDFTGGVLPFWTVIVCIMATIVVGVMQDRGVIKI
jgi:hypothetical protein